MNIKLPKATTAQINYIKCLFIDTKFDIMQQHGFLFKRFNRKYCDELTVNEASSVIEELKEMKERNRDKRTDSSYY